MNFSSDIERLRSAITEQKAVALLETLATMDALPRAIARLDRDEQCRLFTLLPADESAHIAQQLPGEMFREILESLPIDESAAILNQLPSDEQTDLIETLSKPYAGAVLSRMAPGEKADVDALRRYAPASAGGLMSREYVSISCDQSAADVIRQLQENAAEYSRYSVQYLYVATSDGRLVGVAPLRSVFFLEPEQRISAIALPRTKAVSTDASLSDLRRFFDQYDFLAVPVTEDDRLVGIVLRSAVEEAIANQAESKLLRFSGIIRGEEFRTMPTLRRATGRMTWLSMTMVLNLLSASVIGVFEDTLSTVVVLAVFLPVISGMSGNAGNQAIGVTVRELTLGLLKQHELGWVVAKEAATALISGVLLGSALGMAVFAWKSNAVLAVLVGSAQCLNILAASCLGGTLPLLLQRLRIDPALAAAPLMTAMIDACGFFVTLGLASMMLPLLV